MNAKAAKGKMLTLDHAPAAMPSERYIFSRERGISVSHAAGVGPRRQ